MGNVQSTGIDAENAISVTDLAERELAAERAFLNKYAKNGPGSPQDTPIKPERTSEPIFVSPGNSRDNSPTQLLESFEPRKQLAQGQQLFVTEQSVARSDAPISGAGSSASLEAPVKEGNTAPSARTSRLVRHSNNFTAPSDKAASLPDRPTLHPVNASSFTREPITLKKGTATNASSPLSVRSANATFPLASSLTRSSTSDRTNNTTKQDSALLRSVDNADKPTKLKRPASSSVNAFTDERRSSSSSLPKIAKRKSTSSPRSPAPNDQPLTAVGDERPPRWYKDLAIKNVRARDQGDVDTLLQSLRTQITNCQKPGSTSRQQLIQAQIRDKLHKLVFKEVNALLLKSNRMLHDEDGLPQLFDTRFSKGVRWPFDIQADAHELYNKWCRRVFDVHLFRGIASKVKTAESKKEGLKATDSIDPNYPAVPAKYHGNGDLQNGQWWPTQLCALRDGAHGVSQGGICGRLGDGAFSCIMSGGHDYPDVDEGNVVLYCGTDSTDGTITEYTQRMIESSGGNQPVRVIRSHNLEGVYAPVLGFRYDGLYDVVSYEQMDPADSKRQRHRFRLVRQDGQDPIRGGSGPERRPTEEEVAEFRKHMKNAGKAGAKA